MHHFRYRTANEMHHFGIHLNAAVMLIDDFLIYVMEGNHPEFVVQMKQDGSCEEAAQDRKPVFS